MTNSEQAIREICEKYTDGEAVDSISTPAVGGYFSMMKDLTALISEHYVSREEHEAIAKMAEALKADMNAAKLELALMRKFILWTGENCQYYPDVNEWMYFESPMTQQYFKGTDELFNYWKENEQ